MNIPDAAIEAAMPAFRQAFRQAFWANDAPNDQTLVRDVIEAAMPEIREALAQEIEAHASKYSNMSTAARIVRGGTP